MILDLGTSKITDYKVLQGNLQFINMIIILMAER